MTWGRADTELKPVLPQRVWIQAPLQFILRKTLGTRWAEVPIDCLNLGSILHLPGSLSSWEPRAELANRKGRCTRPPASRPRGPQSSSATASPSSHPQASFSFARGPPRHQAPVQSFPPSLSPPGTPAPGSHLSLLGTCCPLQGSTPEFPHLLYPGDPAPTPRAEVSP